MPEIVLYGADGSCALVAHMLLRELQVPFKRVRMTVGPDGYEAADGSLSHAAYLKIHPSGYVPALSVDGFVVTENPAILQYIASFAPERELLGSTTKETYRAMEWMAWLSGTLHGSAFAGLWRPTRFVDDAEYAHAAIVEKGHKKIIACYGRIEESVEGEFAVGSHLTVVDFYLHNFWRWGCQIGVDMTPYPRYRAVARQIEQLERAKAAIAEEDQPLTTDS